MEGQPFKFQEKKINILKILHINIQVKISTNLSWSQKFKFFF